MSRRPRIAAVPPRIRMAQPAKLQQAPRIGATRRDRGRGRQEARLRIWLRDGPNCMGCGKLIDITPGTPDPFELDHTVPLWAGGQDNDANRQCLCPTCHQAKTAREAAGRARGGVGKSSQPFAAGTALDPTRTKSPAV